MKNKVDDAIVKVMSLVYSFLPFLPHKHQIKIYEIKEWKIAICQKCSKIFETEKLDNVKP